MQGYKHRVRYHDDKRSHNFIKIETKLCTLECTQGFSNV